MPRSGRSGRAIKAADCDFIYGRTLTGEVANWFTVALTVRIGDDE
jgi:hypothetical protein